MLGSNHFLPESPRAVETLKRVKDLQTQRNARDQHKQFYIEGIRNFVRAADHRFEIETILFSEKLCTSSVARQLVRRSKRAGVPTLNVTPETYRSLSVTEHASGVGAILRQRWDTLESVDPQSKCLWIVLEAVGNAGNLGTLIRTAEVVGANGFILLGRSLELHSPATVRATMGALYAQRFIRSSLPAFTAWIRKHGLSVVGASPDGNVDFDAFPYPRATFLFLGEERKGLTHPQRNLCSTLLRIPMVGTSDSFNLAVAGSLMLYQIYRHKRDSSS
jgi:RNA methyltransferase, TrmH family